MRADVGQAAQGASGIASEEQRLVEEAGQQRARRERAGHGDVGEIADPLPTPREDPFTRERMGDLVAIKGAVDRRGDGDIGIDLIGH